jgi:hypothetical protein
MRFTPSKPGARRQSFLKPSSFLCFRLFALLLVAASLRPLLLRFLSAPSKTYLVFTEPKDDDLAGLCARFAPFALVHAGKRFAEPAQSERSWLDVPLWLSLSSPVSLHLNAALAEQRLQGLGVAPPGSSPALSYVIHGPLNLVLARDWVDFLSRKSKRPLVCVFARRKSLAERVFQAFDAMGSNLASADEVLGSFDELRARARAICDGAQLEVLDMVRVSGEEGAWEVAAKPGEGSADSLDAQLWQPLALSSQPSPAGQEGLRRNRKQAYVALLTAADTKYAEGALVLGRSLALFDASRERILLATGNVPDDTLKPLRNGGWTVRRVDAVKEHWFLICPYIPARQDQKVRWGLMASKLLIFDMVEFDLVLYLDADVVVTGRIGEMFGWAEKFERYQVISEGGIQHGYVNAGVMLVRPSHDTFTSMMAFFASRRPMKLFGNLVDCTEMGLINAFFGKPDRLISDGDGRLRAPANDSGVHAAAANTAILPVTVDTKLMIGRPDLQREYNSFCPWAVHFMRKDHCAKPWDICTSAGTLRKLSGHCDLFPYHLWCRLRAPGRARGERPATPALPPQQQQQQQQ